jgi:hypothetical protein
MFRSFMFVKFMVRLQFCFNSVMVQ